MKLSSIEGDLVFCLQRLDPCHNTHDIFPEFSNHGFKLVGAQQCERGLKVSFYCDNLEDTKRRVEEMNNSGEKSEIFENVSDSAMTIRDCLTIIFNSGGYGIKVNGLCSHHHQYHRHYHHHQHHHRRLHLLHLFRKRRFLPCLTWVRRLPQNATSPHIPEHCPFRLQTEQCRVIFHLRPLMLRNKGVGSSGDGRLPTPSLTALPIELLARLQTS